MDLPFSENNASSKPTIFKLKKCLIHCHGILCSIILTRKLITQSEKCDSGLRIMKSTGLIIFCNNMKCLL